MAAKANIVIDQGANLLFTVIVTDVDGIALDLTGYTGAAKMRKEYTSSNAAATFTVVITAGDGQVDLSLTAVQTANITAGEYVYDCELTKTSSNTTSRIVEGRATVTPEVTR
jgi:hypothetical protein